MRLGIIGAGGISERFAKVLITVPQVEFAAVAASTKEKADAFAQKFGAKKSYGSYRELISDSEVDAVYIGLTNNFHYDITKLCLNHNKAVLCEKPFVTNKKDAEELIALAKEKNLLFMEAMWTRCMPVIKKAKEWVAGGKIGEMKLIQASFCFHSPFNPEHRVYNPALGGGSMFDVGVYPIEFATGITGENPIAVNSMMKAAKTGVDELASIHLSFANGILAALNCGISTYVPKNAMIYGTDGYIIIYNFSGPKRCERYDSQDSLVEEFTDEFEDGFIYEIRHFADLFDSGKKESDLIPHRDTIACAGIFDALRAQWGQEPLVFRNQL